MENLKNMYLNYHLLTQELYKLGEILLDINAGYESISTTLPNICYLFNEIEHIALNLKTTYQLYMALGESNREEPYYYEYRNLVFDICARFEESRSDLDFRSEYYNEENNGLKYKITSLLTIKQDFTLWKKHYEMEMQLQFIEIEKKDTNDLINSIDKGKVVKLQNQNNPVTYQMLKGYIKGDIDIIAHVIGTKQPLKGVKLPWIGCKGGCAAFV